MTSLSKWPTTLSDKDRAFLQENLDLELGPFEEDPQAQALYAVESNEIAMRSPVWTRGQVESWVGARATSCSREQCTLLRRPDVANHRACRRQKEL